MLRVYLNRQVLEKALTRHNLSRKALALQINISRGHLSRIIWGKTEPSCRVRQQLLQHFPENTFDDLFIIKETDDDRTDI